MQKIIFLITAFLIFFSDTLSAQHLKKDGTPDMRYKENKINYSTQSSVPASKSMTPSTYTSNSTAHLKKDGTPDMRYKENKVNYSSTSNSTYKSKTHYTKTTTSAPKYNSSSKYSYIVKRDANGRIHRSQAARLAFMKQTGYPKGRPGYIIDHILPLKRGGCDCPGNMQWQTIADAKAKDKVEEP